MRVTVTTQTTRRMTWNSMMLRLLMATLSLMQHSHRSVLLQNLVHAVLQMILESYNSPAAYQQPIQTVATKLQQPSLKELMHRFLYNELYATDNTTADDVPLCDCPDITGHISVHYSATATFYAPSKLAGIGGLH